MRTSKALMPLILKAVQEKRALPLPDRPNKAAEKGIAMAKEWKWSEIQAQLEHEVANFDPKIEGDDSKYEGAEDGEYRVSMWLGSQLGIAPSGKFYMPWATSNLKVCSACRGRGKVKARSNIDLLLVEEMKKLEGEDKIEWPGDITPEWATYIQRKNVLVIAGVSSSGVECEKCGGNGFPEATTDAAWYEHMKWEAEKRGLCFECEDGEYFVFKYFQVQTEE